MYSLVVWCWSGACLRALLCCFTAMGIGMLKTASPLQGRQASCGSGCPKGLFYIPAMSGE